MGLICQNSIPLAFVDCVICWAAELTQVDISRKKHKRPLKVHVAVMISQLCYLEPFAKMNLMLSVVICHF